MIEYLFLKYYLNSQVSNKNILLFVHHSGKLFKADETIRVTVSLIHHPLHIL